MGKLIIVVGGQYGSEGKGAIAAHLAKVNPDPIMAVRVGGPNAGHTVYDDEGRRWPLRQLPTAAVSRPDAQLVVGPGSEVDMEVLRREVADLEAAGHAVMHRLHVDPQATLLEPRHIKEEQAKGMSERIGSTAKGIGAARADRIWRRANLYGGTRNTALAAYEWLGGHGDVLIEAAQGYGLGLHAGFYPHCTSGDCTAVDAAAMAGITPWAAPVDAVEPWVVFRPYPIRVAGNSGPMHGETSWKALGLPPEYTTVTQKERRVGRWDPELARRALQANGGGHVALTMLDQVVPAVEGLTEREQLPEIAWPVIEGFERGLGRRVELVGTSPTSIVDLRAGRPVQEALS